MSDDRHERFKRVEAEAMRMYVQTDATASDCAEYLAESIPYNEMGRDCVRMWKHFCDLQSEKDGWDKLSAQQQAGKSVP